MRKKEKMAIRTFRFLAFISLFLCILKTSVLASSAEVAPSEMPEAADQETTGQEVTVTAEPSPSPNTVSQTAVEVVLKPGKEFMSDSFYYTVSTRNELKKTGTVILSGVVYAKETIQIPETEVGPDGYTYTITQIGEKCFYGNTKVTSIQIPASIRNIRACAFSGCKNLKKIELDEDNLYYKMKGNTLYSKDGKTLVALLCTGSSYTPPSTVTNIEGGAFVYCAGLKSITIPKTVQKIGLLFDNSCLDLKTITFQSIQPPGIDKCIKEKNGYKTQSLCNLDVYHVGLQILVPKGSEIAYKNALGDIFRSNKQLPLVIYKSKVSESTESLKKEKSK